MMCIIEFEITDKTILKSSRYNITILKCGQENCSPRKASEKSKRARYTLHFVLHGSGILKTANGEACIKKGGVFLIFPNEEYEYYPKNNDPWSYVWIDIIGEELDDLFGECEISRDKPYIEVKKFSEITDILKKLVLAYNNNENPQIQCSAYFLLLINALMENKSYKGETLLKESSRQAIRKILIFLNNNYRLNLTCNYIAASNYVSISYLMALFAKEIDMSPMQYLNTFRIAMASEMFQDTKLKISEVSKNTGFKDPLYFSRVFTKVKGISPREYMKGNAKSDDPFKFLKEKNIDYR